MIITENRKTPEPPPVESYTLTVSPEELRLLRRFAEYYAASVGTAVAYRFLKICPGANYLPWEPEKCFL